MKHRSICEDIVSISKRVRYAFVVNEEARLVAFSGNDAVPIGEEVLAQLMEDLLFAASSRKHYENMFGALQFVHMRHDHTDVLVLPFENKVLCICVEDLQSEKDFLKRVKKVLIPYVNDSTNYKNAKKSYVLNSFDF